MIANKSLTRLLIKVVLFIACFTGFYLLLSFSQSFLPASWMNIIKGITGVIAALLVTYAFLRWEKKQLSDIDLQWKRDSWKKLMIGFVAGLISMGLLSGGVLYFSGFQVIENENSSVLKYVFASLFLLPLTWMEEIVFRGYTLQAFIKQLHTRGAILISALLFGAYHLAYGWSIADALLGAATWGVVFGTAALHFKGIAMPTGLHFAVNVVPTLFADNTKGNNLFVISFVKADSPDRYHQGTLLVLLPQLIMLAAAIIYMEWYIRKMNKQSPAHKA